MFSKYFLFLCVFIGLSSCQRKGVDDSASLQKNETSDTAKYIRISDAKSRLESWSKLNTLIFHDIGEPDDLHPTNGNSQPRSEIFEYTQQFLFGIDYRTLKTRAILVEDSIVVSEDGLEYTYILRKNPKWDDGTAISKEDILFTFKANKCPLTNNPHSKPGLENLKDVEISNKNNIIVFKMKRLHINNAILARGTPIMQRKFFDPGNVLSKFSISQFDDPKFNPSKFPELEKWATEFNGPKFSHEIDYLVGAGPYKILRWNAGQSLTLVRKQNHWSRDGRDSFDAAYPEKIVFKINRDVNSQMLEFKSQTLDVSTYLSTVVLVQLRKDKQFNENYNSRFTNTYDYSYLAMNTKPDGILHKKYFVDKKVRRAMAYLVPLELMNKIINKGMSKIRIGPVSVLKPEFNDTLKSIPFNVSIARKLLDEAGWIDTDGDFIRDKIIDGEKVQLSFNLNYMTTRVYWKDIAQIVSEAMYKAGVKANVTPLDFAVHYDKARNHDFDMMLAGWAGNSTPEDFTQVWHTSSWSSKGSNFAGFGNGRSDQLIDSIKYTINDDKRIPIMKRFQAFVYEEQPYVFLFSDTRRNVIHKRFGNQEMYNERPGVLLNTLKLLQ